MLNQSFTDGEVLEMLQEEIGLILEEAGLPTRSASAEDRLAVELGLKSLDLARLVAALEMRTGADPFQELVSITTVRTVGDLLDAYRRFWDGDGDEQEAEELLAAQQRAVARKNQRGVGV